MNTALAWFSANWKHLATMAITALAAIQGVYNWPDPKAFALITSLGLILGIYAGHQPGRDQANPPQ